MLKPIYVACHQPLELPELMFTPHHRFGINGSEQVTKEVSLEYHVSGVQLTLAKFPSVPYLIPWANIRFCKCVEVPDAGTEGVVPGDSAPQAIEGGVPAQIDPIPAVPKAKRGPGRKGKQVQGDQLHPQVG